MADYRSKECAKVGSALEWRFEKGERMSFSCSTKSEQRIIKMTSFFKIRKGCVCYIFASFFCRSKREHL